MAFESRLSLTVDSRTGERNLKRFRGELGQTERRGKKAFSNIKGLVVGLSGALAGLGAARYFNTLIRDSQEFESRMLSINALIKANGSAAGFTANALREQAEQLALTTLQSTRGVLDAQKVLLSFRRVSGSAFTQAIELSADLSAVLGTDMSAAALQLGKALENPVEGISALSRSGTTFTQTQKDTVKAMVETNRLAEAQALILAEVRSQVGGSGAGQAQGLAGAFDTLGQRIEEFGLASAGALDSGGQLANIINRIAEGLNKVNETIEPGNAERIFELLEQEIDLRSQLSELKSDDSLFGAPAQEIERLESRINDIYKERMSLLKQESAEQQAQADAVVAGREKQLEMEEQAAAERLRIEREKQAELARISEEARSASVNGIITQLQNEALALQLSSRALLQHQLNLAGATEQERELALATHDAVDALKQQANAAEKAGKESAEAFINPWQSTADSVAQSLQDALASGDWDDVGDSIGNALATAAAGALNKSITDHLSEGITAESSQLAQMGAAFAGPIAGAIAGAVIQRAMTEVADFFSLGDWDPTEARQAAQGTGTVLADMNAKSESIRRAVEGSESGIGQLVGINQNMLRALQSLQLGIGGASARVARGSAGIDVGMPGMQTGAEALSFDLGGGFEFAADKYLDYLSYAFTAGLVDFGKLLGGKSRKVDDGIQIVGGYIGDLIDDTIVNAYATFRVKKNALSSTKTRERYERIGGDVEQQFALVFEGVFDSVEMAAESLGIDAASRMAGFSIGTQKLSLEGLSADEKQKELEAYFGTVFDNLAGFTIPWLEHTQKAGEGLGETLARVVTNIQVAQEATRMLGLSFEGYAQRGLVEISERLIEASGGMEKFISGIQSFTANFATEAQQFDINLDALSRGMGRLPLPETREGFYKLMQAQDATSRNGAENIATLLRVQGAADSYYTALEDSAEEAAQKQQQIQSERLGLESQWLRLIGEEAELRRREIEQLDPSNRLLQTRIWALQDEKDIAEEMASAQRDLLGIQRDAISEALQEAERASDSVARALSGLTIEGDMFAAASRARSLAQLESMASSGRVGSQGQLDTAITGATSIQAGEFGNMNDYIRSVSRTGAALTDLKWITDKQVSKEQKALEAIERRLTAMGQELAAVGKATAKHTAKSAKVLERIEMDGLEVRA